MSLRAAAQNPRKSFRVKSHDSYDSNPTFGQSKRAFSKKFGLNFLSSSFKTLVGYAKSFKYWFAPVMVKWGITVDLNDPK